MAAALAVVVVVVVLLAALNFPEIAIEAATKIKTGRVSKSQIIHIKSRLTNRRSRLRAMCPQRTMNSQLAEVVKTSRTIVTRARVTKAIKENRETKDRISEVVVVAQISRIRMPTRSKAMDIPATKETIKEDRANAVLEVENTSVETALGALGDLES